MDFTSDLSSNANHSSGDDSSGPNGEGSSSSFLGLNNRNNDANTSKKLDISSDIDILMLSKEDKKRLKLEETKEKLFLEREKLLKEVETLKSELEHVYEEKERKQKDASPEVSKNGLDDNVARTLVDLMTLSSMRDRDPDNESDSEVAERIDGNSDLQSELSSKYDTLPLLNMNLRLKYLKEYLYPFTTVEIDESKENGEVTVKMLFKRNPNHFINFEFKVVYDSKREHLTEFSLLKIEPNRVKSNMRSFLERYQKNPTMIIFHLIEYDRLLQKREDLMNIIKSKYKVWIVYDEDHQGDSYTTIERELQIKDNKSNNKELIIRFKITNSSEQDISMIPRSIIDLKLYHNGIEVVEPNVNQLMYSLVKEYGLKMSIFQIIQTVLFPVN